MTRKSSRKTQRSRKPVKRSRKPVKRSRKPVKRSRKPVKRSLKPVKRRRKRSLKPVKRRRKRSLKPVKRSRKRSRKPVKRSRKRSLKPVKFKISSRSTSWIRTLRNSVKPPPNQQRLQPRLVVRTPNQQRLQPRLVVRTPKGQFGKSLPKKDYLKKLGINQFLSTIPLWVLQAVRTHPSQPYLSDEITKKHLGTIMEELLKYPKVEKQFNTYFFEKMKKKYLGRHL